MSLVHRIGSAPAIPMHPNCQPVFVHRSQPDLIAAVIRMKRAKEHEK